MAGFTVTRRGIADGRGSRTSASQLAALTWFVPAPTGDTTGARDTASIHATRTTAGVGGTITFQPGTYWVTGLSASVAGQHWKLPIGCTIKMANANNAPVLTVGGAGTIIEGPGTFDGNAANNTGGSNLGIWVTAAGCTVRGVTVQNNYQASIYFQASATTIQGNTVLNTVVGPSIYSQPGSLADLNDSHVLDNIIDKSSQNPATAQGYGIQLHGGLAAATFTATSVLNNATLTSVSSFTGIANGVMLTGTNIPVGATVQSFNSGASTITMTLPASGAGTGSTITLNYGLRGTVVSRNEIKLPVSAVTTMLGIEVWGYTPGALIAENRTYGGYMGISLDRADNGTLTANNVEAYVANGLEVANCTGVTISSNTCDAATIGGDGIIFDGLATPSTKCTATGNAIVRATSKAIFVISNGDHIAITGNTITTSYGMSGAAIYIQLSPSTTVTGNMLYCVSLLTNDAIVFEGAASSGGVVSANVIEGWTRNAVTLFSGPVQTIDRIILGPNVLNNNGGTFGAVGSAVIGSRCRFVFAEQAQASPNTSAITVTASPFTYTNNDHNPEMVYITGGTVSAVAKNAINIFTASPCSVALEPGEAIVVTYTVAPTMNKDVG